MQAMKMILYRYALPQVYYNFVIAGFTILYTFSVQHDIIYFMFWKDKKLFQKDEL